jgi:hypothetical protein
MYVCIYVYTYVYIYVYILCGYTGHHLLLLPTPQGRKMCALAGITDLDYVIHGDGVKRIEV